LGKTRTNQCTKERTTAEGRMELRHDGALEPVLHVCAFNVLSHVPQPNSDAEEEQGYRCTRNGGGHQ
jgi:hypothetical protein